MHCSDALICLVLIFFCGINFCNCERLGLFCGEVTCKTLFTGATQMQRKIEGRQADAGAFKDSKNFFQDGGLDLSFGRSKPTFRGFLTKNFKYLFNATKNVSLYCEQFEIH